MVSDRQLIYWFNKYNRLYFGDSLPQILIYWEPPPSSYGNTCRVEETPDQFIIRLDPATKDFRDYWHILLLHEMVHVKLWPKHPAHQHGVRFQTEMKRLVEMDALKRLW